ncbi:MAG: PEP-CTERM sorting domain-containing protein [Candidatus Manganitrophus sp.]|nr:MAG: PEP-CTERM sorting domain-containing protein [Candidatus Manganitrophus sp.]
MNSEIAKLDDVGVISPEADAALNIDFTSGASVTLRTATTSVPVTGLILFEDAGLDPFSLRYCYNVACTQSDILFNGLNSSTTSTILASNAFGTDDVAPGIDQAYWFVFDQAVTGGYFKIGDTQNFGGNTTERLEVDYLGVTTARASVPAPSTLLLLGAALMVLPLLRKRQSQRI